MAVQAKEGGKRADVETLTRETSRENTASSPIIEHLRRQVANAFVLHLNYKHYHWQTFGPLFRDLHLLFDEFGEAVLESIDQLAERVRMIGQDPPARMNDIADLATVMPAAPHSSMMQMVEEARNNALVVIREIREAAKVADDHDDPGTVDLMSKLVQIYEKQEWWLRDILRKQDGLCK